MTTREKINGLIYIKHALKAKENITNVDGSLMLRHGMCWFWDEYDNQFCSKNLFTEVVDEIEDRDGPYWFTLFVERGAIDQRIKFLDVWIGHYRAIEEKEIIQKQKSYAETMGEEPFDWNAFLEKVLYTMEELKYAEYLACSWHTCPCGNQSVEIPRLSTGQPIDKILHDLGYQFSQFIRGMYFDLGQKYNAQRVLQLIEKRSLALIKELE